MPRTDRCFRRILDPAAAVPVLLVIALIAVTTVGVPAAARASLIAIAGSPAPQLIAIDPVTGAGSALGPTDLTTFAFGLSDRGNRLYTYDQTTGMILELNPTDGSTLAAIDVSINVVGEGAIAFRSDGTGFLSQSGGLGGTLYSFDLVSQSSEQITSTGDLNPDMDGLDFDAFGTLFGINQSPASGGFVGLYTIDQAMGAATLVGSTGITVSSTAGLTFAPDGTLYAVIRDNLYSLDLSTGAATLSGSTGFTSVSGLTWLVPEPSTLLLLAPSLAWLAVRARRNTAGR